MESQTRGGAAGAAHGPDAEFRADNPVGSFISAVGGVILHPVRFFAGMERRGGFFNPALFAAIVYAISAILGGIVAMTTTDAGIGDFVAGIVFAPIVAVVVLFIVAAIFHLLVKLIVGPNSGYEATFRAGAYSSVTSLVSWIPFVGPVLGLYSLVLYTVGIRELHDTTTGKAALVVLIPAAIALAIGVLVTLLVGIALLGMLS